MAEGGEPYENIPLDILNEYDDQRNLPFLYELCSGR